MESSSVIRGEGWAREQIHATRPIIFPQEWTETDRTISGEFVIEAIQNKAYGDSQDGLQIENAIIASHLYRRYLTCHSEVSFHKCLFKHHFELPFSTFNRRLRFVGCTFDDHFNIHHSTLAELACYSSKDGTITKFNSNAIFLGIITTGNLLVTHCLFANPESIVSFNTTRSVGNMSLEASLFAGPVDLAGLTVETQLNCTHAQFLSTKTPVGFNSSSFLKGAMFDNSRFMGGVDFTALHVGQRLQCIRTIFASDTQEVDFSTAVFDGPAILENCIFKGPLSFTSAIARHDLYFRGSYFTNQQAEVTFTGARVSGSVFFDDCQFSGPFKFVVAQVEGLGSFNRAKFAKIANLQAVKVAGSVHFRQTEFEATLDLSGADITGQLIIANAKFTSTEGGLILNSSKVKRGVFLDDCQIKGFMNCVGAFIGGQLGVTRTHFSSPNSATSFSSTHVEGDLFINECQFAGPFSFVSTNISGQFLCTASSFLNESHKSDFAGFCAQGSVMFWGSIFNGPVRLRNGQFMQNLSIATAQFNKEIDLSNVNVKGYFYVFFIPEEQRSNTGHSGNHTKLPPYGNLNNFRFAGSDLHEKEQWKLWLRLPPHTEYAPDPFLALEQSFRRIGRDDLADKIYYSMKVREGHDLWRKRRYGKWLENQALKLLVGYGVHGSLLWLWAIPMPLIFAFACHYSHDTISPIRVLSYAIDVFLPVDLHQKKNCDIPDPLGLLTELWGWIIVPLALAQLGGVLKKKEP